jgi:hypothetical protein
MFSFQQFSNQGIGFPVIWDWKIKKEFLLDYDGYFHNNLKDICTTDFNNNLKSGI